MKTLLCLLFLIPALAIGKSTDVIPHQYQTVCLTKMQLEDTLDEFGEEPIARAWMLPLGQNQVSSIVIFISPITTTFTVIEKVNENKYCILAMGTGFEAVPENSQKIYREERKKKKL